MTIREKVYADPFCRARMSVNVRDWYNREFAADDLGLEIDPEISFGDVLDCLYFEPWKIYACLGVGDSLIRERVFGKLAEYMKVGYDSVYDMWMRK